MTDLDHVTRASKPELRQLVEHAEALGLTSTEVPDLIHQWQTGKRPPKVSAEMGHLLDLYWLCGVLCTLAFGPKALER